MCKFEDHTTRCTKCWSHLTLKYYANTFEKANTQLVEECRRTISYLKGYCYPKLYRKKLSNQNPTANTVSTTRVLLELLVLNLSFTRFCDTRISSLGLEGDWKLIKITLIVLVSNIRDLKHRQRNGRRRRLVTEADWAKGFVFGGENEV